MPDQFRIARERMVAQQLAGRGIRDERVLSAMRKVPRHLFVDEALRDQAYSDFPLPIGHGQTISQPYIVALMTELLQLNGHEKILEIGTGSGYQTAVLAELSRFVYSVERISALLFRAKNTLHGLGYSNVHIKLDDGTWGWRDNAPYDAILVTAGAPFVPEPLLEQLADSGVMVIPVGDEFSQVLVRVHKFNGSLTQETITGVRFVKLVGEHGWRE
ncbi:MAG: protein-L-isoaspartate(D-aspartate) O-methyltransferase [Dissulfuribacterales bacterium]